MELNCADYADNPELLSSVLFGHVEGAFTGAVKYKKELMADGGYAGICYYCNLKII